MKQATLVETDDAPADAKRKLLAGEVDAYGANRQRLTNLLKEMPGYRLLPDSLFGVTQAIVVAKGKPDVLKDINAFVDDVRASGFLQDAVARSGVIGLEVAPAGAKLETVICPGARRASFLLVALDLALLLLSEADIVEAVEQAMLAVRVDVEMNDTAIGTTDFLLLEIDRQRRVGAALSVVEKFFKIFRGRPNRQHAVLEHLL